MPYKKEPSVPNWIKQRIPLYTVLIVMTILFVLFLMPEYMRV